MTKLPTLLAAALAALLLSGCIGGNSITVAGQGWRQGDQSDTLRCATSATIGFGVQGGGNLQVRVLDGAGAEVFERAVTFGQDGGSERLNGKEGTWKLIVATAYGFGGQYAITLTC